MRTVRLPRQRGPRPRHIKGLPGAESQARAGVLFAGVLRARRVPRAPEAAGEAVGVHAVVVAQIVVLCARPSPREHRFDDQIKDLFLAEVNSTVISRPGAAASSGGTARPGAATSGGGTVRPARPGRRGRDAAGRRPRHTRTLRLARSASPFG